MHTHKVRRRTVMGRDGKLRGIVSVDDMFRVARSSGEVTFAEVGSVMKRLCEPASEDVIRARARAESVSGRLRLLGGAERRRAA